MIINILQHTPVVVWAVLVALLALGLSQTRERDVSRARITVLPLVFVVLSIVSVYSSFGTNLQTGAAWIAGFGAVLALAGRAVAVRGATLSATPGKLRLPGSWLPLALILGLFCTRYCAGVLLALHPDVARDPMFAGGAALVYGVFAGLFWARARSLRALLSGAALKSRAIPQ